MDNLKSFLLEQATLRSILLQAGQLIYDRCSMEHQWYYSPHSPQLVTRLDKSKQLRINQLVDDFKNHPVFRHYNFLIYYGNSLVHLEIREK